MHWRSGREEMRSDFVMNKRRAHLSQSSAAKRRCLLPFTVLASASKAGRIWRHEAHSGLWKKIAQSTYLPFGPRCSGILGLLITSKNRVALSKTNGVGGCEIISSSGAASMVCIATDIATTPQRMMKNNFDMVSIGFNCWTWFGYEQMAEPRLSEIANKRVKLPRGIHTRFTRKCEAK